MCYMLAYERVQEVFLNRRACTRVRNSMSGWFPVKVGLCRECVMSPCLFDVHMNGVLKGINASLIGKVLNLLSADGRFPRFTVVDYTQGSPISDAWMGSPQLLAHQPIRLN